MPDIKGEYKFSALAVMLFGVAGIVIGNVFYFLAAGTGLGGLGVFVSLGGLVLLIIGIVRAVRERGDRAKLSDQAAHAVIASSTATGGSVSAELHRLTDLHASGALSDVEFTTAKAKVLQTDND
jgi:hypothetical protein